MTPIPVTLGSLQRYSYNGDFSRDVTTGIETTLKAVTAPTFTTTSGCEDFAIEMHVIIQYAPDTSTNNGFNIEKVTMDVIYGKWEPATVGEEVIV